MNLKEAFRYQNKLQRLSEEAESILRKERNVTRVECTALLHKVNPEAQDETTVETFDNVYGEQITAIVVFLMYLLEQREKLTYAIRQAKKGLELDFDGEASLNSARQRIATIFRYMDEIRSTEHIFPGGGTGYKFNAEGNQVSYRCDLKKVTTINFDRNLVRKYITKLNAQADEISTEIDKAMVNAEVDYQAPFDVNDGFDEAFEAYMAGKQ